METCRYKDCDQPARKRSGLCHYHYDWLYHRGLIPRVHNGYAGQSVSAGDVAAWRDLYVAIGDRGLAQLLEARVIDEMHEVRVESVAELAEESPTDE